MKRKTKKITAFAIVTEDHNKIHNSSTYGRLSIYPKDVGMSIPVFHELARVEIVIRNKK